MSKGILKRQESSPEITTKESSKPTFIAIFSTISLHLATPDSTSKQYQKELKCCLVYLNLFSVKWDEEKLKVSEAIKMTIPKGQIDEPKTPFQHGQYGQSK